MPLADDLLELGQKVRQVYLQYGRPITLQIDVGDGAPKFTVIIAGVSVITGNANRTITKLDAALGNPEGARKAIKRARKQSLQKRMADDQAEIDRIDVELSA